LCYRITGTQQEERRGQGEGETRLGGDKMKENSNLLVSAFPLLTVSLSPCPPFSLSSSPWLYGSVSPWLVRQGRSRNGRYLRRRRCPLPTSTLRCPTAP